MGGGGGHASVRGRVNAARVGAPLCRTRARSSGAHMEAGGTNPKLQVQWSWAPGLVAGYCFLLFWLATNSTTKNCS